MSATQCWNSIQVSVHWCGACHDLPIFHSHHHAIYVSTFLSIFTQGFCFEGSLSAPSWIVLNSNSCLEEFDESFWKTVDGNSKSRPLLDDNHDMKFSTLSHYLSPSKGNQQDDTTPTEKLKLSHRIGSCRKKCDVILSRIHSVEQIEYLDKCLSAMHTDITFMGRQHSDNHRKCCSSVGSKRKVLLQQDGEYDQAAEDQEQHASLTPSLHSFTPVCKAWKIRRAKGIGSPRRWLLIDRAIKYNVIRHRIFCQTMVDLFVGIIAVCSVVLSDEFVTASTHEQSVIHVSCGLTLKYVWNSTCTQCSNLD